MLYAEKPDPKDLPSEAQLRRSSVIAFVTAIALAVVVVLPAEFAIDPTGAGRVLGLTEMGEIKKELKEEWENDEHHGQNPGTMQSWAASFLGVIISPAHAQDQSDAVEFTLEPGATYEVKLTMKKGDEVSFNMAVSGGRVNFDHHAHGDGSAITYEKGRGSTGSEGSFVAAFDGDHGWFWRNRDSKAATVTLTLQGAYSALKQGS